jgi:glycosyltransferase involved in cell wall biosynthesis
MRILFLTIGKRTTPSTRFRVKQYVPYLEESGIQCDIQHIPHAFHKRWRLLRGLKKYDAVIIQKKLFSAFELSLIAWVNRNIIYDFDDLVTAEHPMHKISEKVRKKLKKNEKRFANTCKTARGIIAGNDFLAETASKFNENVSIIPTPVTILPGKVRKTTEKISEDEQPELTIGWIGTKSNLFYLDRFGVAWREIHEKYPLVTLTVICNTPYESDLLSICNREWRPEREFADLQSFDIGIMPLTNDDWSRGKCGFKLLQYMAAGLPTVSSAIGANLSIVEHGVTGFLAKDEDEWVKYLTKLITDPELRETMGANARAHAERYYSVPVCKDKLVAALNASVDAS